MNIDQILDNIYPLPPEAKSRLKAHVKEVAYPKGHILFKAEKVETRLYFIKSGIVRAYANSADQEITFWFGKEGDTAISMKSYNREPKKL